MAFDLTLLKATAKNIIAMIPTTVTIDEEDYDGGRINVKQAKLFEQVGYITDYVFSVFIAVEDLPAIPELLSEVTVENVTYNLAAVTIDAANVLARFDLSKKT